MRDFNKAISDRVLVYDGSKGVILQRMGLTGGKSGDLWNIDKPSSVKSIYEMYRDAGSDIIQTNTFTANRHTLGKYGFSDLTREINYKAAVLAREVMGENGFVAGSIGPTGVLLEPYGDMSEKQAMEIYYEQALALAEGGADVINLETFMDENEAIIASEAALKCGLPVICCMTFDESGRTMMGNTPASSVRKLLNAGVTVVGANCSVGPSGMVRIIDEIRDAVPAPLCVKPNAGMPRIVDNEVFFDAEPESFEKLVPFFIEHGVRIIGGCCGTDMEYIKVIRRAVDSYK